MRDQGDKVHASECTRLRCCSWMGRAPLRLLGSKWGELCATAKLINFARLVNFHLGVQAGALIQEFQNKVLAQHARERESQQNEKKQRVNRSVNLVALVYGDELERLERNRQEKSCNPRFEGDVDHIFCCLKNTSSRKEHTEKIKFVDLQASSGNVRKHLKSFHRQLFRKLTAAKKQGKALDVAEGLLEDVWHETNFISRLLELYGRQAPDAFANNPRKRRRPSGGGAGRQTRMTEFLSEYGQLLEHRAKEVSVVNQALFFVKHHIGFNAAEDASFRRAFMAHRLDPDTALSRTTYRNTWLPRMFATIQMRIREKLANSSSICLTSDGWTCNQLVKYVVVTGHWLDPNDYSFVHATLDLTTIDGSATGERLFAEVDRIANETLARDTVMLVSVADGAANAQNACAYLSDDGKVWCGAHLLQLVVRSLLETKHFKSLISDIRSYVAYVRSSTERRAALLALQKRVWCEYFGDRNNLSQIEDVSQQAIETVCRRSIFVSTTCEALGIGVNSYSVAMNSNFGEQDDDSDDEEADDNDVAIFSRSPSSSSSSSRHWRPLGLIRDAATRWSSTYAMVSRFAALLPFLFRLQKQDSTFMGQVDSNAMLQQLARDHGEADPEIIAQLLADARSSGSTTPSSVFDRICDKDSIRRLLNLCHLLEPFCTITRLCQTESYATLPHFAARVKRIDEALKCLHGASDDREFKDDAKRLRRSLFAPNRFGFLFTQANPFLRGRPHSALWSSLLRIA
jgi:hypothetical protein